MSIINWTFISSSHHALDTGTMTAYQLELGTVVQPFVLTWRWRRGGTELGNGEDLLQTSSAPLAGPSDAFQFVHE